ncbi:PREDICTED: uncharacterized protein LOC104804283 isoform X2 [Tarenaya hassleriana]|uniref:uncharacterized protein LOC104804283 isoform X2 n=1 Tax=Tarenaya hassleriana TaxID=28532 RepID=UPI00053C498D|nr:PREDICTED: uncharacterized protein LOC104804283 isoform X2 [Tarenaya hassleriana]
MWEMSSALPPRHLLPLATSLISPPLDSYYSHSFLRSTFPNLHRRCSSASSSSSSSQSHSHAELFPGRRKYTPSSPSAPAPMCFPEHVRDQSDLEDQGNIEDQVSCVLESDEGTGIRIPSQAQSLVEGSRSVAVSEVQPVPDVDYIQELLAIQQQGPRSIGFFGTRNMGFMHQELIEILSYAMKNHIYTSGASGTNAAVIRGALRAEKPELLTVILPQSLKKQPPESQELLSKVKNVIEKPHNDHLPLIEASRLCNMDIISQVQQVICFAFHDSKLLMETCQEAKSVRKIVTLFYLD